MESKLQIVKNSIEEACIKCSRSPESVKLMAVSKFHPAQEVINVYNEGQNLFGENRVQEICQKFPEILTTCPNVDLHLIGSLQRNKVKQVIPFVSTIESLDRLELAMEIQKRAENYFCENPSLSRKINILFEVHTGEESKSGYTDIEELYKTLDYIKSLQNSFIKPCGFMTMAPNTEDEKLIHSSFEKLRLLKEKVQKDYLEFDLQELSMGMSHDFEIAIQEGSTQVRIGTAIFGERIYSV